MYVIVNGVQMIVGYARVSTTEQLAGFEAQLTGLKEVGCEKVFQEKVSAVKQRDQLEAALEFIREGDTFTVTKLDRLARSTQHLLEIVGRLNAKGASLKVLNIGLDTTNPTGRLMLVMLGAIAEFERELMLERQKDGVQAAKAAGKYHGRQPTARAKSAQILQLLAQGKTRKEVAETVGVGVASVYRVIADSRLAA
jgi:DNA invertase Pin-like site-specific DNA recombinase